VQSVWDARWHLGRGKARDEVGGPESLVKGHWRGILERKLTAQAA